MADWPDQKIYHTAIEYIEKHAMKQSDWQFTLMGSIHADLSERVALLSGELPVVSSFVSETSWYVFTTRRVLGCFSGEKFEAVPNDIARSDFGDFKQHTATGTQVMRLVFADGSEAILEYETHYASMAPIYYFMYWTRKYPRLDKLKG